MKVIKNKRTLSKEKYTINDKVITLTEPLKNNDVVILNTEQRYIDFDGSLMSREQVEDHIMSYGKYPKKLGKGVRELVKDPDVIAMSEPLTIESFRKYLK